MARGWCIVNTDAWGHPGTVDGNPGHTSPMKECVCVCVELVFRNLFVVHSTEYSTAK